MYINDLHVVLMRKDLPATPPILLRRWDAIVELADRLAGTVRVGKPLPERLFDDWEVLRRECDGLLFDMIDRWLPITKLSDYAFAHTLKPMGGGVATIHFWCRGGPDEKRSRERGGQIGREAHDAGFRATIVEYKVEHSNVPNTDPPTGWSWTPERGWHLDLMMLRLFATPENG